MPESRDSGQNGTVMAVFRSRSSSPRSRPLSPWSISNCHVPLRHSHSARTNCGRGYSSRGVCKMGLLWCKNLGAKREVIRLEGTN